MTCNLEFDIKDTSGKFVISKTVEGKRMRTLAGALWGNLNARIRKGGSYQDRKNTYVGSTHEFIDFQDFAVWARMQIGYGEKNFEMDKDLLFKGNKVYSKETVVFIPSEINNVLVKCDKARNPSLPIGVCLHTVNTEADVEQAKEG